MGDTIKSTFWHQYIVLWIFDPMFKETNKISSRQWLYFKRLKNTVKAFHGRSLIWKCALVIFCKIIALLKFSGFYENVLNLWQYSLHEISLTKPYLY